MRSGDLSTFAERHEAIGLAGSRRAANDGTLCCNAGNCRVDARFVRLGFSFPVAWPHIADQAEEAFNRAMGSASHLSAAKAATQEDAAELAELDRMSHADLIERRLQAAKLKKSA